MKILILNHSEVELLLPMAGCIEVMAEALADLSAGRMHQPLRTVVRPPDAIGLMGLMPSYRAGAHALYGLKAVCVFPGNTAIGKDAHQGSVMLFSADTGELLALLNASAITAIRTAAVSAVATKLLARENAHTLAIIGAGVQGKSHLEAIPLVRDIREVRIVSRTREKADALAGKGVRVVDSVEEAVKGADIIVTATSSREPIIRRNWLDDGVHINAVGSSVAVARELDSDTVAASSLFVDRRESTVNESGDYLSALREGAITDGHIRAELGEILTGTAQGRASRDEITLFKSLGLAIEDLASAASIYDHARATGRGIWVDF